MSNKRKATHAQEWKKSKTESWKSVAVELPSGNTALLRRVGLEQFLLMGMIPNQLVTLMQAQIQEAKGKLEEVKSEDLVEDLREMLDDPEKLIELIDMIDKVTIFCVLDPKVEEVPTEVGVDRVEGALYIDEVDLTDKLYIFQWAVGGVEELESFRSELDESLGSLLPSSDMAGTAEQSGGAD